MITEIFRRVLTIIMTKKSKCLLCNKEQEDDDEYNPWNTTYEDSFSDMNNLMASYAE
jgi:hypothetical protein